MSCTQVPVTVQKGNVMYTDVPGLPDTNPDKTKIFYDVIIEEAKKPLTAIFFVFAVDMRMDKATKDRIRNCSLLFNEINRCSAAKILILNDIRSWSNPNCLDEKSEEYKTEKAIYDQVRLDAQKHYEQDIKNTTGIEFYCTKVINGINKKINPDNNMNVVLHYLELTLQSFPCEASPHLRNFKMLEKVVTNARENCDFEQQLIDDQEKIIKSLEKSISALKVTEGVSVGAVAVAAVVTAFFTTGVSLVIAGVAAGVAKLTIVASTKIAIALKEKELKSVKEKLNKDNLKKYISEYKEQCKLFEDLKAALNER
uniref:G domain-containing protein n=1 Tax=Clytia hemisphaerica TaxID=252671 RepID=A0A7M5WV25_9CNID